jgi:hypothetical protein
VEIKDYMPVSLQHSVPKLIAKILSNRLQPKIKIMVDPIQSGFVKNTSIVENFATVIEMVQCANKTKNTVMVLN